MAQRIKDEGGLVGDLEVVEALFDVLVADEYRLGTVVDGFPRTKIQVDVLRLMHQKMKEQAYNFDLPRPRLRVVVLFVDEATSIARQLRRGKKARDHNKRVKASGVGELKPVRETDLHISAARKRYQMYLTNTLAPLEELKVGLVASLADLRAGWLGVCAGAAATRRACFSMVRVDNTVSQELIPFNTVDANGDFTTVEKVIQHEMKYESAHGWHRAVHITVSCAFTRCDVAVPSRRCRYQSSLELAKSTYATLCAYACSGHTARGFVA